MKTEYTYYDVPHINSLQDMIVQSAGKYAAQIVVDVEAFIELSEMKGVKITPGLLHTVIAEEIRKTNEQLSRYKQIKKFKIRGQEFEKTTTQKIKRHLVQKN